MGVFNQKASNSDGGGGGGFEKAPAGNHPAVLVAIVDLGNQWQDGFGDQPGKFARRGYFAWELVTKRDSKGQTFVVGCDLTLSLHKKAKLRQWIDARRGKNMGEGEGYDIGQELGQPCLLQVIHTPGGYPRINGVSAVPDLMTVPAPSRKPYLFDLDEAKLADSQAPADLPGWLPYLYGRSLEEVIADRGKGGVRQAKATEPVSTADVTEDPNAIPF